MNHNLCRARSANICIFLFGLYVITMSVFFSAFFAMSCFSVFFFQDFNINFNNFNIFFAFLKKKKMITATKQAGWQKRPVEKMILASTKSQEDENSTQSRLACSTASWLLTLMLVIISLTFIIMEFVQVAWLLLLLFVSNSNNNNNNTNKLYINNKNTMSSIC